MYLLLSQLAYTSFAGLGFNTLASPQVPSEIQKSFMQSVVSQYWDSYSPLRPGSQAAYLHQLAPNHILFGWLYNDGADDMGRSDVPYFICYYLAEPLSDFHLDTIFTCLHRGPAALIDRYSQSLNLETIVVPDLWSYQSARPGVAIPLRIRQHSHVALERGKLLDLFVTSDEQSVIESNRQTYEQIAHLSAYSHYVIEGIGTSSTALAPLNATAKTEAIQPYHRSQPKLPPYQQDLGKRLPPQRSKRLQQSWARQENTEPIRAWLSRHANAIPYPVTKTAVSPTVAQLPSFPSAETKSFDQSSIVAYRNAQLLLKIGIVATVLALATSIYGIFVYSAEPPSQIKERSGSRNTVFAPTLAEASHLLK